MPGYFRKGVYTFIIDFTHLLPKSTHLLSKLHTYQLIFFSKKFSHLHHIPFQEGSETGLMYIEGLLTR
jgi:hypothetical protein